MAGHGLCCAGEDLTGALALAEELEHLAAVQLLTLDK
jgi:L-fuculose-phosphate aldolase